MICKPCQEAADQPPPTRPNQRRIIHPRECGCTCQHLPVGSVNFLRSRQEVKSDG